MDIRYEKIDELLLDVRRMAEIKIVKHGGVRKNLLYSRIPCVISKYGRQLLEKSWCVRENPTTVMVITQ